MDMEKATPQQISDYKRSWKNNAFSVRLHSDMDVEGKDWCRKHLNRWQWSMDKYTDVYEHTFHFEHKHDAAVFQQEFPKYTNMPKETV